jgi:hypothetical protein
MIIQALHLKIAVAEVLSQSSVVKSATLAVPHGEIFIFRYLITYLETRYNLLKQLCWLFPYLTGFYLIFHNTPAAGFNRGFTDVVTNKVYIRHFQDYNINNLFSWNTLRFTVGKRTEKFSHKKTELTRAERNGRTNAIVFFL